MYRPPKNNHLVSNNSCNIGTINVATNHSIRGRKRANSPNHRETHGQRNSYCHGNHRSSRYCNQGYQRSDRNNNYSNNEPSPQRREYHTHGQRSSYRHGRDRSPSYCNPGYQHGERHTNDRKMNGREYDTHGQPSSYRHGRDRSPSYCNPGYQHGERHTNDRKSNHGYQRSDRESKEGKRRYTDEEYHGQHNRYSHGNDQSPRYCNPGYQRRDYEPSRKRNKLTIDDGIGDPSCDQQPGLPLKRICHGQVNSEDTSNGQPKGYSQSNGEMVVYNHSVKPVGQTTPDPHSVSQPPNNARQEKKVQQKVRQRKNQHSKDVFKKPMKRHLLYLEKMGWFKDSSKEEIIDNPSYSVMHSLSQGYTIKLWSCTHNTYGVKGQLHLPNVVRLVVPPDMILIWHQRLYHAGARCRLHECNNEGRYGFHLSSAEADKSPSRQRYPQRAYTCLEDARFFGYVYCPKGKRFMRSADGKLSNGDRLYTRGELYCANYNNPKLCPTCSQGECVVDLSSLKSNQYTNGETVLGDLNKLGWVLLRSRCINRAHETEIRNIIGKGKWCAIGDSDDTRMMKYQTSTTVPKAWKEPLLLAMFKSIKTNIFNKVLPNDGYDFAKFNVLKNQGVSLIDQAGHFDYQP